MQETWKDVPDYDGFYQVSNTGKIKSYHKPTNNKSGGVDGSILYQGVNQKGYKVCYLCKNGVTKNITVHRVVALTYIPNPENKPQVNHINGIRDDNRPENLEWATCQENIQAAFDTGLKSNAGEKNNRSIFTNHQINKIRQSVDNRFMTVKQMAKYYRTSYNTMWKAVKKNYQKI